MITNKSVLFDAYEANFRRHLDHAVAYVGRDAAQAENADASHKRRKR